MKGLLATHIQLHKSQKPLFQYSSRGRLRWDAV